MILMKVDILLLFIKEMFIFNGMSTHLVLFYA